MTQLESKLRDKSAAVAVIGLGYVGLPLAAAFASAGFKVLGIDLQQKRVDLVNRGRSYKAGVDEKLLGKLVRSRKLIATTDHAQLRKADAVCVCVPTPLTRTRKPDLSHIIYEAEQVSRYLKSGHLVVLESTTFPGTTREVMLPILERSGLKAGHDFFLAFSPGRADPGGAAHDMRSIPKIVGGIDAKSSRLACLLYSRVADTVLPVSSAEVAEMTKVFENVFRSVNVALVNELAQLCDKMGISVWEVIRAASSKPFGYMPFYPGPGTGGHSIPLDPYYLADKALEYDFHTRFIELAADINESMPGYVASQVTAALNSRDISLGGAKILVLGAAYKKDVADVHASPCVKLIAILQKRGACVDYHDPYVPQILLPDGPQAAAKLDYGSLKSYDCVLIATDHSAYDYVKIARGARLVFDARGATREMNGKNIVRLGE
ncbi:MAG: nucleotide sugar dehydrogenase [Dehalococcoidia bacterium]